MPGYRKTSGRRKHPPNSRRRGEGPQKRRLAGGNNATGSEDPNLRRQLNSLGLELREIEGDGNCLFRALSDQLDGSVGHHLRHRAAVVAYMRQHRADFEPFIVGEGGEAEEEEDFDRYLRKLGQAGTFGGNDVLVAFSRLSHCEIVVHQGGERPWSIGQEWSTRQQLHIAFHDTRDHYSSVRRAGDKSTSSTAIRLNQEALAAAAAAAAPIEESDAEVPDWTTDGDGDDLVANVMAMTGCRDEALVEDVLLECGYDVALAVSQLAGVIVEGSPSAEQPDGDAGIERFVVTGGEKPDAGNDIPAETGVQYDPSGDADATESDVFIETGAKSALSSSDNETPAVPPSEGGSQRSSKRQKKQARKLRAAERRREERLGLTPAVNNAGDAASDPTGEFVINGLTLLKL